MMRRVAGTVVVVGVVVVLATPAVRRTIGARVDTVAAGVRARIDAFRADYAAREAELRRQLLPADEQQARAAQHRAETR